MRSTDENLLLWEQRIKERIQNRLSIDEWCKRNGVTKHKYNYWNHKVRQNQNQTVNRDIVFADVTANLTNTENAIKESTTSDFQLFFKDIRITIPSNFNSESLAGLIKVLQAI